MTKILVVTSEPLSGERLRGELGDHEADSAEVMIVAPALHESAIRFWMSDADEAIARAQAVQSETVSRLRREGVNAEGDAGESEPLEAIGDVLTTFDADRILVFAHPEGERSYREDLDPEELERRFGLPAKLAAVPR